MFLALAICLPSSIPSIYYAVIVTYRPAAQRHSDHLARGSDSTACIDFEQLSCVDGISCAAISVLLW